MYWWFTMKCVFLSLLLRFGSVNLPQYSALKVVSYDDFDLVGNRGFKRARKSTFQNN